MNDLILLTDIPSIVQIASVKTQPEQGEDIKSISEQKRLQDLNSYL